ncbi:hypothetical protein HK096_007922, partial [Nowakowskiella sp. JEL0078]
MTANDENRRNFANFLISESTRKRNSVKSYLLKRHGSFYSEKTFCQLLKPENVPTDKLIAKNILTNEIIYGLDVAKLMTTSEDGLVYPNTVDGFQIFAPLMSPLKKIVPGSELLYELDIKVANNPVSARHPRKNKLNSLQITPITRPKRIVSKPKPIYIPSDFRRNRRISRKKKLPIRKLPRTPIKRKTKTPIKRKTTTPIKRKPRMPIKRRDQLPPWTFAPSTFGFGSISMPVKPVKPKVKLDYSKVPIPAFDTTQIVISFDATGSMGQCINQVKGAIREMVKKLIESVPNIYIALIAHQDYDNNYLIKKIDFTNNVEDLQTFVNNAGSLGSGGSWEECYEYVLNQARTTLSWSEYANKAMIMFGDSPPHTKDDPLNFLHIDWLEEIEEYRKEKIRIYSVNANRWPHHRTEYFFQKIATRTDGVYLELSDFKLTSTFIIAITLREGAGGEALEKLRGQLGDDENVTDLIASL